MYSSEFLLTSIFRLATSCFCLIVVILNLIEMLNLISSQFGGPILLHHIGKLLSDHYYWYVWMSSHDRWHNRSIGNSQSLDAFDLQSEINVAEIQYILGQILIEELTCNLGLTTPVGSLSGAILQVPE